MPPEYRSLGPDGGQKRWEERQAPGTKGTDTREDTAALPTTYQVNVGLKTRATAQGNLMGSLGYDSGLQDEPRCSWIGKEREVPRGKDRGVGMSVGPEGLPHQAERMLRGWSVASPGQVWTAPCHTGSSGDQAPRGQCRLTGGTSACTSSESPFNSIDKSEVLSWGGRNSGVCPGGSQKGSHATLLELRNKQRDLENQGREEGRGVAGQGAGGTAEATDSPITRSAEDTLSLTLTFSPRQPRRAVRRPIAPSALV